MDEFSRSGNARIYRWLKRLVKVEQEEVRALLWSFSYFFALLCSYYIVRPMRDEMGIAGGVEHLQWLFTGTFLAMLAAVPLFGWITSHYPRKTFLPLVYFFFIANLLLFFALFRSGLTHVWVARAFFIWTSVFNLFIVSVFWSFMADLFSDPQAKRLFGFIAAGGTAGALAGPALTATLAIPMGPANLLLISAAGLGWAVLCIHRLSAWRERTDPEPAAYASSSGKTTAGRRDRGLGGGAWAGIRLIVRSPYLLGICLLILLFTTLSTFLYFQQAYIIEASFADPAKRTTVFAGIDFAANALTLLIQVFFTGRIVKALGLAWSLALIPLMLAGGFLALGAAPLLGVLVVVQVVRRAGNYALMKPSREMLFVVVGEEEKYKAKNVIDTVIYRSGDVVSAWAYTGLQALGLGLSAIAFLAVPVSALWAWICYQLGKAQEKRAKSGEVSP
jgi:AAA family ATP:ADP antiporter